MNLTFTYGVLLIPYPMLITWFDFFAHGTIPPGRCIPREYTLKLSVYYLLGLTGLFVLMNFLNDLPPKKKKKKSNAGFDFYYK